MLALVAHDNMKRDLAEWVDWNSRKLSRHHLVCTGTTGKMVEKTLRDHREEHEDETEEKPELKITLLKSGPLGGDQQLCLIVCWGASSRSHLLRTQITGTSFSFSRPAHCISRVMSPSVHTISAMSVRSMTRSVCFMRSSPNWPSSSSPAVSMKTQGPMP